MPEVHTYSSARDMFLAARTVHVLRPQRAAAAHMPRMQIGCAVRQLSSQSPLHASASCDVISPESVVDIDQYPIHLLGDDSIASAAANLVVKVRSELLSTGKCLLPGFMRRDAAVKTVQQVCKRCGMLLEVHIHCSHLLAP